MIDQLIQSLKSSESFGDKFKSNDTHYTLLTSGGYRKYDKGRIVVIVFDDSKPRLVVKFYKNSNSIFDEYETQTQIYKIYGNLITKPLGIEHVNDYDILVEEPVLGKNLTRYIYENLDKHTILEIFKLISTFHENLNSKLEISNIQNLTKEVDQLFQTFYSNFKLSNFHEAMINDLRSVFLENFKNKKIFQRFSNNDFILNNFIIHKNNLTLTDFEFSTKTHLYFLEWFKLFRYQWIVSNDYIHDLTISEITDPFYKLGLKEFSNYQINAKFELACRLIFEIFDFTKRFHISSLSTNITLIDDMKKFLNEFTFRYNNLNITQKESDLDSSEKEFFNKMYKKLTQYNKQTDELLDLRKSNDEYKSILKNTLEQLDENKRKYNNEKFLAEDLRKCNEELYDEVIKRRNHNDELREEIKRLELDHENYKKSIQTAHENYKKSIQTAHENYIRFVESSLLWKFTRAFDKLIGKKK